MQERRISIRAWILSLVVGACLLQAPVVWSQTEAPRPAAAAAAAPAAAVDPSPLAHRKPLAIPASSIIVVIRRAYVFGSGADRFCSPEVTVYNQANKGVAVLMVAAEYFQNRNGVTRRVGSTHNRFTVDPNENVSVGFNRLSTDSCDGVYAKASVSVCLWRDRSGCEDRVVFSDSGQLPLLDTRNHHQP